MRIEKNLLTALGVPAARADKHLHELNIALPAHGIDTPLRAAHFLAQVLHESGKFRWIREIWGPTRAQRGYEGRRDLGNTQRGDGKRYMGRGLIQLTGRANYTTFNEWLDAENVVADPDLVATKYPVSSAVYYWTREHINALADLDDVVAVTRAVNGGENGLDDRMALLEQAKSLLRVDGGLVLDNVSHEVAVETLNFRKTPRLGNANRLPALSQGTRVRLIPGTETENDNVKWVQVQVSRGGAVRKGYVALKHLTPLADAPPAAPDPVVSAHPAPATPSIAPVHLSESNRSVTRARDGGRAHALGEAGQPRRRGQSPAKKAENLLEIAAHLDSPNHRHLRYRPKRGTTFCNIYAYDFCYLARTYLPRVWWKDQVLEDLRRGEAPPRPAYGTNVRELNANMLLDWLDDYGEAFGWRQAVDLSELQSAANNGSVCVIVGQRTDTNRPGHISVVLPEHAGLEARRDRSGAVSRPVESQAGSTNFRATVRASTWWTGSQFRTFAFWRHP